jgi:hypothetical protein
MKIKLLLPFLAFLVCFALAPRQHAADKPADTEEIRRERAKQTEKRRREEPPLRGALIMPGKTNAPPNTNVSPKLPQKL